ncbi:MAG: Uma2 family endonuclease [bacterium]
MLEEKKIMTYNEYLTLTEESSSKYEFVDGKIYVLAAPTVQHEIIKTNTYNILYEYFKESKCKPFTSGFAITQKLDNNIKKEIQPDVLVVCDTENIKDTKYYGIPSMVIEVVSPSNMSYDYITKTNIYMNLGGIKEYLIINPMTESVRYYKFKNNEIEYTKDFNKNEVFASEIFERLKINFKEVFNIKI